MCHVMSCRVVWHGLGRPSLHPTQFPCCQLSPRMTLARLAPPLRLPLPLSCLQQYSLHFSSVLHSLSLWGHVMSCHIMSSFLTKAITTAVCCARLAAGTRGTGRRGQRRPRWRRRRRRPLRSRGLLQPRRSLNCGRDGEEQRQNPSARGEGGSPGGGYAFRARGKSS